MSTHQNQGWVTRDGDASTRGPRSGRIGSSSLGLTESGGVRGSAGPGTEPAGGIPTPLAGDPADLADAYASGTEKSGVACIRAILVKTKDEADAAAGRLDAGESFATVAGDVSVDSSASTGGVVNNPKDGSPCIEGSQLASTFAPEFVDAVNSAEVGVPTDPFEIPSAGWVILVLRPFDEVSNDAAKLMSGGGSDKYIQSAASGAKVWVSARYGKFDPTTAAVVPIG